MGNNNHELDLTIMDDFNRYVEEYTSCTFIKLASFDPLIAEVMNMSFDRLQLLNADQCYSYAFKVSSYAFYLQTELNENQAKLNWCEDAMNRVVAKDYDKFDKYMKYEIRRQSVVLDNSFATQLELLRSRLSARVSLLQEKIKDVRSMVTILQDMGKRKTYQ